MVLDLGVKLAIRFGTYRTRTKRLERRHYIRNRPRIPTEAFRAGTDRVIHSGSGDSPPPPGLVAYFDADPQRWAGECTRDLAVSPSGPCSTGFGGFALTSHPERHRRRLGEGGPIGCRTSNGSPSRFTNRRQWCNIVGRAQTKPIAFLNPSGSSRCIEDPRSDGSEGFGQPVEVSYGEVGVSLGSVVSRDARVTDSATTSTAASVALVATERAARLALASA
jgi:hypothetical protein